MMNWDEKLGENIDLKSRHEDLSIELKTSNRVYIREDINMWCQRENH